MREKKLIRTILITDCGECDHFTGDACRKANKIIDFPEATANYYPEYIPDWCPLEDAEDD